MGRRMRLRPKLLSEYMTHPVPQEVDPQQPQATYPPAQDRSCGVGEQLHPLVGGPGLAA